MGVGGWRAAPLRVGSPAHPRNSPEQISGDPEAQRNARARCSGPPVQLRWTTLRVQGPTLRDAALANGGNGSPPVAPRLLHQPLPRVPPNRDSTVPNRDSTVPDSNSDSGAGGTVFEEDFPKSIDTQEIAVVPGTSQQAEKRLAYRMVS